MSQPTSDPSDYFDFNYEHTHESVRDGSPAMLISQTDTTITLTNEDGHEWTDPRDNWRPIAATQPGEPVAAGESDQTGQPVADTQEADGDRARLTAEETEILFQAWLTNDVTRGIEWLIPAVETIIAARSTT